MTSNQNCANITCDCGEASADSYENPRDCTETNEPDDIPGGYKCGQEVWSLITAKNTSDRFIKHGQRGVVIGKSPGGKLAQIEFDPPGGVWSSEPNALTTSPQMDLSPRGSWEECEVNGWYSQDCANLTTITCINTMADWQCDEWVARGECTANPKYMKSSCRKSCHLCSGSDRRLTETNLPNVTQSACVGECDVSEAQAAYISCCGCAPETTDNAGNTFSWTAVLGLVVALQLLL